MRDRAVRRLILEPFRFEFSKAANSWQRPPKIDGRRYAGIQADGIEKIPSIRRIRQAFSIAGAFAII